MVEWVDSCGNLGESIQCKFSGVTTKDQVHVKIRKGFGKFTIPQNELSLAQSLRVMIALFVGKVKCKLNFVMRLLMFAKCAKPLFSSNKDEDAINESL